MSRRPSNTFVFLHLDEVVRNVDRLNQLILPLGFRQKRAGLRLLAVRRRGHQRPVGHRAGAPVHLNIVAEMGNYQNVNLPKS